LNIAKENRKRERESHDIAGFGDVAYEDDDDGDHENEDVHTKRSQNKE
jgi:hypothetical protein